MAARAPWIGLAVSLCALLGAAGWLGHAIVESSEGFEEVEATPEALPGQRLVFEDLSPSVGALTSSALVRVSGRVKPALPGRIYVYSRWVELDAEGRFATTLGLSEGEHKIALRVEAGEGEAKGGLKETLTLRVDRSSPELQLARLPRRTLRARVRVKGGARDASPFTLTLNGRALTCKQGRFAADFELPGLGVHELRLVAQDAAGHRRVITRRVERVERLPAPPPQLDSIWREVRDEARRALLLVEVRLEGRDREGRKVPLHARGTGVVVSERGHVLVAKHLVEPWKFRALAARLGREGIEVVEDSYVLHAWQEGASVRRGGKPELGQAWSSSRGTLRVVRTAPDVWVPIELTGRHGSRKAVVHSELHSQGDLALLQLSGPRRSPPPLRFARSGAHAGVGSEVMVLGYPRAFDEARARPLWVLMDVRGEIKGLRLGILRSGGHLGGPVLDREGRMVGFSVRLVFKPQLSAWALGLSPLRALLLGGRW